MSGHWSDRKQGFFARPQLVVGILLLSTALSILLAYTLVNYSPILAVLVAVVIPAGIAFITRPKLSLLLLVFTVPLESLNDLGPGVSTFKLLSLLVFGSAAAHFLILRKRDRLVSAPQNWLVMLFVLSSITSLFVAISPSTTISAILKLLRVLLLYFVVINVIHTRRDLSWTLWAFLMGGLVSTLYGMFDPSQQGTRVAGTLGQANLFALSMAPRLPIALGLFAIETSKFRRYVLILATAVIAYGVALSGSRGGLLAAGIAFALFSLSQQRKVLWLSLVTVISITSLALMPLELKQRVGLAETSSGDDLGNSTDRRETYQQFGLQLWQEHPLLGVGMNGFGTAYAESEFRFLQSTRKTRPAHNTFLEIAVGAGIAGLLPFILILAISLYQMKKRSQELDGDPDMARLASAMLAALGAYTFGMFFGSRQFEKTLWLLVSLVVVIQNMPATANHWRQNHPSVVPLAPQLTPDNSGMNSRLTLD